MAVRTIHKHRSPVQRGPIPFDDDIGDGIQQRFARRDKQSVRLARADMCQARFKGDALICAGKWLMAVNLLRFPAHIGRDVCYLPALRFTQAYGAFELLERHDEERGDIPWLKFAFPSSLHQLAHFFDVHARVSVGMCGTLIDKLIQPLIHTAVDHFIEFSLHSRIIAILDGSEHKLLK